MDIEEQVIRNTVVGVLQDILENSSELVGYGEYGRGWVDGQTSMKMRVGEVMETWKRKQEKG